jgi:hypothetical protein
VLRSWRARVRRTGVVSLLAVAVGGLMVGIGSATPTPTATSLTMSGFPPSPQPNGTRVLIEVAIAPSTATGTVTLREGSTLLATGGHYGTLWSYQSTTFAVGAHLLTATFTPDDPTGFSASQATLTYVISGGAPTPTPTATATSTVGAQVPTPTPTESHQSSSTPTTSSSSPAAVVATVGGTSSSGGALPFTGLFVVRLLVAGAALLGLGMLGLVIGRRKRPWPAHQA